MPINRATRLGCVVYRMRTDKRCAMARKAARAKICFRVSRLRMRIMAGSAPHFSLALACAPAQSELLDMTDYFERLRMQRIRRGIGNINRKDIFELLACLEITKLLAPVENPRLSTKMTLLANAIPSSRRELLRIHDRMRHRIAQVSFSRTMTPVARYSLLLKWRGFIAVQSSSLANLNQISERMRA